jgi:transketolase
VDGHSVPQLLDAMTRAKLDSCPRAIIARTIKGKGVSFMEDVQEWHVKPIDEHDFRRAYEELTMKCGGDTE